MRSDDFAVDVITRIDPSQQGLRRKLSQINTQFQSPLGRTWKVNGLLRYNGATGKFESIPPSTITCVFWSLSRR